MPSPRPGRIQTAGKRDPLSPSFVPCITGQKIYLTPSLERLRMVTSAYVKV